MPSASDWTEDERVTDLLDEADVLLLAVSARRFPHVTPVAFDRDGRDLWIATPRRSVKVRAISRDHRVGALVRRGDRAVMLGARARLVDPLTGRGLGALPAVHRLPTTALGFFLRNDRRVSRVVRDSPTPTLVLSRVGIRLEICRVALLEQDRVLSTWGGWAAPSVPLSGSVPPRIPDLDGVPAAVRSLLSWNRADATLGWHCPLGPVALPARWDPAGVASVPSAAMALTGALVAGPACLTVDRSEPGVRTVRGIMLAGTGHSRADGATTEVSLTTSRVVWWSGTRSAGVTPTPTDA